MDFNAKAEDGGLFQNGIKAIPLRITLNNLGFPPPPTPINTDKSTT